MNDASVRESHHDDTGFPTSHTRETTTSTTASSSTATTSSTIDASMGSPTSNGPAPSAAPLLRESWIEEDELSFDADLAGPSTPNRLRHNTNTNSNHHSNRPFAGIVTENWDDDFEDGTDSPRPGPGRQRARTSVPPTPASMRSNARTTSNASQIENWDEEFQSVHSSPASKRIGKRRDPYSSGEDDDDDTDFGFDDREEEDKTVTARSRRSTVGQDDQRLPPLPVFIPPTNPSTIQPFPRSPTTSVFSVPGQGTTSARNSIAAYSSNSMTHLALHPTVSRASSASGKGFSRLSSSPPHKERERRRRLRKKSRPPGADDGIYEMANVAEDDYYPPPFVLPGEDAPMRELTPPRSPEPGPSSTLPREDFLTPSKRGASPSPTPISPPTKTPLLQRIGSVKKWGVRRKRASTTPSDVVLQESSSRRHHENDLDSTPRPTSSMSSNYQSSPTKQSSHLPSPNNGSTHNTSGGSSSWFFRGGGGGGGATSPPSQQDQQHHAHAQLNRPHKLTSQSRSSSGFSVHADNAQLRHQPSLERQLRMSAGQESSPSKLVKRKSFGFVQIRRSVRPGTAEDDEAGRTDDTGSEERMAAEGKGKGKPYAGLGRSPSQSSSSNAHGGNKSPDPPSEDGSRGFMGSVRRISLGGRLPSTHIRTKSNVSASDRARVIAPASRNSTDTRRSASPSRHASNLKDPSTSSPLNESGRGAGDKDEGAKELLPPIQLQTPASTIGRTFSSQRTTSRSNIPALPPLPASVKGLPPQAASLGRSTIAPNLNAVGSGSGGGVGLSNLGTGGSTGNTGASGSGGAGGSMRRNSLGDLKIPARITQAQTGLRRDLMMVKEFAANVGQLKELQQTYHDLVTEVNSLLDAHHQQAAAAQSQAQVQQPVAQPAPRSISPNIFRRARSNTNPKTTPSPAPPSSVQQAYKQLASAFYTINSKYRISWECAELLIELGGGAIPDTPNSAPPASSQSEPLMNQHTGGAPPVLSAPSMSKSSSASSSDLDWKKHGHHHGRERAITLSGDDTSRPVTPLSLTSPLPPSSASLAANPTAQWRASTGRNDLSQRQLLLLKEMLNSPGLDPIASSPHVAGSWDNSFEEGIPEEGRTPPPSGSSTNVNKTWRWGDGMNSTLTLPPSEEGEADYSTAGRYERHLRPVFTPSGGPGYMSREDLASASPGKKRRTSRLGMSGIRDMLRALKKNGKWDGSSSSKGYSASGSGSSSRATPPKATSQLGTGMNYYPSTTSLSTESSSSQHQHQYLPPRPNLNPQQQSGRRRAKTSTEPDSIRSTQGRPTSPYHSTSLTSMKVSPRRPSIASIFRLGKSHKTNPPGSRDNGGDTSSDSIGESSLSAGDHRRHGQASSSTGEEEDWDKLEIPVDYDAVGKSFGISKDGTATVRGGGLSSSRGRSPYILSSPDAAKSNSRVGSQVSVASPPPPMPTTPRRPSASASQTSLHERIQIRSTSAGGQPTGSHLQHHRLPRLSNVDEHVDQPSIRSASKPPSSRSSPRVPSGKLETVPLPLPTGMGGKSGSVRSMPQGLVLPDPTPRSQPHRHTLQHQVSSSGLSLAMTPENIRPLLENAREVHARLVECICEIRSLLESANLSNASGGAALLAPTTSSSPISGSPASASQTGIKAS